MRLRDAEMEFYSHLRRSSGELLYHETAGIIIVLETFASAVRDKVAPLLCGDTFRGSSRAFPVELVARRAWESNEGFT
jgi:hypothetical protein